MAAATLDVNGGTTRRDLLRADAASPTERHRDGGAEELAPRLAPTDGNSERNAPVVNQSPTRSTTMWAMLKTLLVQGILAKTVLRSFGWLGWLLPVGFLLKFIGLPLLAVLGALALPVLILLFVIGLPVIVVLVFGGALMALVGVLLTVGVAAAKVIIPVALVVMLVRWLVRWLLRSKTPVPAPVTTP